MNKNLIGARIKAEKEKIIRMYKNDIRVLDIAEEYGVVETSIYRHLKKWSIPIKRKPYQPREKKVKDFKRKFSPELQVKMKENTKINNKYIKHCEFKHATEDQRLVANIINRPIIG